MRYSREGGQFGLTGIGNDNVQSISHLSDLLDGLFVALLIVRDQLDDVDVRVLGSDFVELLGSSGISSAGKDDGLWLTLEKGKNELVTDTSIGAGDYGRFGKYLRYRGSIWGHTEVVEALVGCGSHGVLIGVGLLSLRGR